MSSVGQVYLEIPETALLVDYRRSQVDGCLPCNGASPVLDRTPFTIFLAAMSEVRLEFVHAFDTAVDCRDTWGSQSIICSATDNLVW